jgi:hypothetical protein
MKKLILCALLAAYVARLIVPMQWEIDARKQWKELAAAMREEMNDNENH